MRFEDWGLVPYEQALQKQNKLLTEVQDGAEDCLVFCSHPPVVTLGRSSKPEDLQGWKGEVVETTRGGRATYHGPNQLVIYPIIDISNDKQNLKSRDVHAFLRSLEKLIVMSLSEFDIQATGGLDKNSEARDLSYTGVWVGESKIASIGIGIKKWVTYHGAALNVADDQEAFTGINPCGFNTKVMNSLQGLGFNVDIEDLKSQIKTNALIQLG